ncbi:GntR family transcriptional regulator [Scopulibacillus darangshiensis]|uniref:GntR family transcriptional regulator n=1 Tax=Scopulibacillus darangshiensis TaxID=442528 RepID=A0A4R2PB75_9BACL|nr:GntR family transcriptional regulator [Scopulibacillus darangshiensis]TCP31554.1 GntR family transcriptional regulator [Scopulibacillus darangshiensis]
MKLDENNPIPLHVQLTNILEKQILDGLYKEKIPSERELMDMYDVSRSTVREAVSTLVQEGILEKRHGRGTFVSNKPVQEWLKMSSFTEATKNLEIKLLECKKTPAPEHLKHIPDYENECYYIERLRLKDQIPVAIERHFYPITLGEQLINYDLTQTILYDTLESHLKIKFWESEQIVSCEPPSDDDAENLEISNQMYLLTTERMMYNPDGDLIEYYKGLFRPDMYSIHMKMTRKSNIY